MTRIKITAESKELIRKAVQEAEMTTSGEIVPYFVGASDSYDEVALKSAVLFIVGPLLVVAILSYAWLLPFQITVLESILAVLAMGVIGFILPYIIPSYKRFLLTWRRIHDAVEKRALSAFVSEEVFYTENRTGILIFISQFEHMVKVIGDTGINAKVDPHDWDQVVALIVEGIKNKEPAKGIVAGISKCGELLQKSGVSKPPDNPNELPDDLRIDND